MVGNYSEFLSYNKDTSALRGKNISLIPYYLKYMKNRGKYFNAVLVLCLFLPREPHLSHTAVQSQSE